MKTGVVIVNLGTPVAPTKQSVRAFLREFLSDVRVVEVPRIVWALVLNLIVIPLRTPRVVKAYQSIWQGNGSPLRHITEQQVSLLQQKLNEQLLDRAPIIRHAMTYSGPSIASVVDELTQLGVEHTLIVPLYPQYSATTTGSVYDQVASIFLNNRNIPQLQVVKQYFDQPKYIQALATTVREHWQKKGRAQRLLMSFHSIPQRYCEQGDPYYEQCKATAIALAESLELTPDQWAISFQSRVGYAKWLSPYTVDILREWGEKKLESVDVICPAFAADCLETLEEIEVENRHVFLQAGGGRFEVIPCLNTHPSHIEMLAALIQSSRPTVP